MQSELHDAVRVDAMQSELHDAVRADAMESESRNKKNKDICAPLKRSLGLNDPKNHKKKKILFDRCTVITRSIFDNFFWPY